jgi:hypothetical protein
MKTDPDVTEPDRPRLIYRSRLLALLVVAAVIGAPAIVLRSICAGHSCDEAADASSEVPFCSLPEDVRGPLTNGFRKGRSPEVLAVTGRTLVAGEPWRSKAAFAWPATQEAGAGLVPIAFYGPGIESARLPAGTGLDDIAPTLAQSIGLHRKFPEVRSGRAVEGVAPTRRPVLAVVIALKGIGSAEIDSGVWPRLDRLLAEGAVTTEGRTEAVPLDAAAGIATIGTGGLPRQHGIVGELVRNDEGKLVRAWSKDSPVSVIATLGDDLDEALNQRPKIGLAGSEEEDRGLIGGNWYVDVDRDLVSLQNDPGRAAVRMLRRGFGQDEVADLLGVALEGDPHEMDEDLTSVIDAVAEASGDRYVVAIAGTGSLSLSPGDYVAAERVVRKVESGLPGDQAVVEAAGASGLFLDQDALVDTGLSEDAAIDALKDAKLGGSSLVVDSFPSIAVSFSKYC